MPKIVYEINPPKDSVEHVYNLLVELELSRTTAISVLYKTIERIKFELEASKNGGI